MIVYLHGLESSPTGHKGRYLHSHFEANCVDLDTSKAIASRNAALDAGRRWQFDDPELEEAVKTPMNRAAAAITSETKLIIGSSFGGAVLMNLMASGQWGGPALFICPAIAKLTPHRQLLKGVPTIILHGRRDELIPISESRKLAKTGGLQTMLWEVDDGHRMSQIVDTGILAAAIAWLNPMSSFHPLRGRSYDPI